MAQITLGIGMSHSPRLVCDPADWVHFGSFAASMGGFVDVDGRYIPAGELVQKYDGQFTAQATLPVWQEHAARAGMAIDQLAKAVNSHKIDALVVLGDDQHEMLTDKNYPAVLVHCGPTFRMVDSRAKAARRGLGPLPDFLNEQIARGWHMDAAHAYPNQPALAQAIVAEMIADGLTPSVALSDHKDPAYGIGHAVGIVIGKLVAAVSARQIPIVPILLNTYFPPNQPTPPIAWRLGQAVRRAVRAIPAGLRVGVIASGGLSHFIVNEEWDQAMLALLRSGDPQALQAIPTAMLQSGNSELLNWIAAASACHHLNVKWDCYAPIYSQPHREGVGLAFMEWS